MRRLRKKGFIRDWKHKKTAGKDCGREKKETERERERERERGRETEIIKPPVAHSQKIK